MYVEFKQEYWCYEIRSNCARTGYLRKVLFSSGLARVYKIAWSKEKLEEELEMSWLEAHSTEWWNHSSDEVMKSGLVA